MPRYHDDCSLALPILGPSSSWVPAPAVLSVRADLTRVVRGFGVSALFFPTMNHLSAATSAYLKSAAHQPVPWWAWGPEAFAEAKRLDRPILLDIGAVWCHWCHVMDGESYEDPAIA